MKCPFCNFNLRKEKIFFKDDSILILRTEDLKGHKERIMVVVRKHKKNVSKQLKDYAICKLIEQGKKILKSKNFCVLTDKYSRFRNHWHRVSSDFLGDDAEQMEKTPKDVIITLRKKTKRYEVWDWRFDKFVFSETTLFPKQSTKGHFHRRRKEVYLFGNDFLVIPQNAFHKVVNKTNEPIIFYCIWKKGRS